tara:strand:- start:97 stop:360 length:264 start_codon:yes stop_codon:yes gene_type:complete
MGYNKDTMIMPKTNRIIPNRRSEEERVGITLEYLCSFVVWCDSLTVEERKKLRQKISALRGDFNFPDLNGLFAACEEYLTSIDKEEE